MGVEVASTALQLRFQLTELTDEDALDIEDIVSELQALVGKDVQVNSAYEVTAERTHLTV